MRNYTFALLVPLLLGISCSRYLPIGSSSQDLSFETLFSLYASYPAPVGWLNDSMLIAKERNCLVTYSADGFYVHDTIVCIDSLPEYGFIRPISIKLISNGFFVTFGYKKLYRHSYLTHFAVLDTLRDTVWVVDKWVRDPTPSPDGSFVAFHYKNNVWLLDFKRDSMYQITNYPDTGTGVIAGVPDWVYEEEFSLTKGMYWSDDGKILAYYVFDQRDVPNYQIVRYEKPYPNWHSYRYPRAGFNPAIVEIKVYNTINGYTYTAPVRGDSSTYVPQIRWVPETHRLAIITLDRQQRKLNFHLWEVGLRGVATLFSEQYEDGAFVSLRDDWFFRGNDTIVWLSERTGFWNIFEFIISQKKWVQITNRNWHINSLKGYYDGLGYVVIANSEADPTTYYPYQIKGDSIKLMKFVRNRGVSYSVSLSPSGKNCYVSFSSVSMPPQWYIYDCHKGYELATVEDNSWMSFMLPTYKIPDPKKETVKLSDGTELHGWVIAPKKKPKGLLVFVYGGPSSQLATNRWGGFRILWFRYLAKKHRIAVVWFDNRGVDGYGRQFAVSNYRKLGTLEVDDQNAIAQHFQKKFKVKPERTAVWGWSYGGYLSGLLWLRHPETFRYAVSVAPVSSWHLYDNIYTERYMDLPNLNKEGYEKSAWHNTDSIPTTGNWLIIHGDYDDNVHVQHVYDFIWHLRRNQPLPENIQWIVYPNSAHGLGPFYKDVMYRIHRFIVRHLVGAKKL